MGIFSRKPHVNSNGMTDAELHASLRGDLERRERQAEADAHIARQQAAKWDRIVRNMTSRGEDHEGRDYAIRNRTRAQGDLAAAETEQLTAKAERSNYRR
ncbi:hypothetical protein [Streptomyces stelliscabiei]|uniref:Uncharacterized protein n=1 Tax=Streptomyces stelliscabiei TaxID=146820 RepID=A0A8I0PEM4_9ACTN|nr:hypothetical protein [Streptomyces stelliscabiei]KND40079.1 hypothetical protein IQ64_35745 [Streptomyces stelliscabiei]MBE1601274.1 hypothetical protein [Streptomyces stelliscabiei]